MRSDQRK